MTDTEIKIRGYFWRRLFAGVIDALFISVIITLMGLFLFRSTDGKIRLESTVFSFRSCVAPSPDNLKIDQADLKLPADFQITGAAKCTFTFMGFVHDRKLVVEEVTKPGPGATYRRWFTYPLDQDGRLQPSVFYLDSLIYILLIGYVLLTEWRFGATLGKEFLKLRVRSLSAPDGKLTFAQAAKRLLIFAWIIPLCVGILVIWIFGIPFRDYFKFLIWFPVAGAAIGLVIAANVVFAIRRGERPWHDRWGNTAVILGREQSIAPTPFTPG